VKERPVIDYFNQRPSRPTALAMFIAGVFCGVLVSLIAAFVPEVSELAGHLGLRDGGQKFLALIGFEFVIGVIVSWRVRRFTFLAGVLVSIPLLLLLGFGVLWMICGR
jgi:hypothetical protein